MPTSSPELAHEQAQDEILLGHGFEPASYDNSDVFQGREVMRILRSGDGSVATFERVYNDGTTSNPNVHAAKWLLAERAKFRKAIDISARLDALLVPGAEPIEAPRRADGDWEPIIEHSPTELEEEIVTITALTKLSGQERVDAIDTLIDQAWAQDVNSLNRDLKYSYDLALRIDRPDIQFTTLARLSGFGMRHVQDPEYAEYSDLEIVIPAPLVRNKFGLYGPPEGQITDLYVKR